MWVKRIPSTTNGWISRFSQDWHCTSLKKTAVTAKCITTISFLLRCRRLTLTQCFAKYDLRLIPECPQCTVHINYTINYFLAIYALLMPIQLVVCKEMSRHLDPKTSGIAILCQNQNQWHWLEISHQNWNSTIMLIFQIETPINRHLEFHRL